MGGEQAANVLAQVKVKQLESNGKKLSEEEINEIKKPIVELYEYQATPYYSTARIWDDGVIDALDMRKVLALGISASLNAPIEEPKFGVFRM